MNRVPVGLVSGFGLSLKVRVSGNDSGTRGFGFGLGRVKLLSGRVFGYPVRPY